MGESEGPRVSLVVAMKDEEPVLGDLLARVEASLERIEGGFEMIAVDDGSSDGTWPLLKEASESRAWLHGVRLSRNFGQHPATFAGLEAAAGDIVVTMDADLQTFPEDIPLLLEAVEGGSGVAYGRRPHSGEGFLRERVGRAVNGFLAAHAHGTPPASVSTFLAARREVVEEALRTERPRPVTPYHIMLGRPDGVASVEVTNGLREKGTSKYGLLRLVSLSADILFGYTRLAWYAMAAFAVLIVISGSGLFVQVRTSQGGLPWRWVALVSLAASSCLGAAVLIWAGRSRVVCFGAGRPPLYVVSGTF